MKHYRIMTIKHLFLSCLCILTMGCHEHFEDLISRDEILKMNPELQQVLAYYKDDTLKLRAAEFLIDNLPYHEGVVYTDMEPQRLIYELFGSGKYTQFQSRDSVIRRYGYWGVKNPNYRSDVYIDPDFLIDNIDWAFKVWKGQPWGKNIGFEQFCEYVLPYRVGNEELYPWREKIYHQFQPIIDALPNDSNKQRPTYIASVLLDTLLRAPFYFTEEIASEVSVGPMIVDTRGGSCLDLADMLVYIYRALGVPCGIDELPVRGNNNVPHYMNFIEDIDGKSYYFSMFYYWHRLLECKEYGDVYGKMFRHTFSVNKGLLKRSNSPTEELYPSFRHPCYKDVTDIYATDKSWELKIPRNKLLKENLKKDELLYLCMSSRFYWIPIDFGRFEGDTIIFKNCHGETVYNIGKFDSEQNTLTMLTDPFWVEKDTCSMTFFTPEEETEDVTLYSKFGMLGEFYIWRMTGGVFEGSNDPDFGKVDTLYKIPVAPERLCTRVSVNNPKKYKYLRYKGPDGSHCDVSEVAFYSVDSLDTPLHGKVVGPKEGQDGSHSYFNVYDKKTDTSYTHPHPNGGWAGIALDEAVQIGKIMYTPRNRDNFVRKGDLYELLVYKNGKWQSKGLKGSTSDSLFYENIPKHALLLLRNHTRGVAERIFEYKGGKQHYK